MLTLLFLLVYLLPVLSVARRIHYVRTLPVPGRTLPVRKITDRDKGTRYYRSSPYTYVNGEIMKKEKVCQTCGGDEDYHANGNFKTIGNDGSERRTTCYKFVEWDQKREQWDKTPLMVNRQASVRASMALGLLWPYFVGAEVSKRVYYAVEPDWTKFAVEYKGAETKAQKIERLQREVKAANDRSDRILASVDKVETLEELDSLVS